MKVSTVIQLLQEYSTMDEEIMVQWWTKKDTESSMADVEMSAQEWTDAVTVWDNEPLGTREAGVLDCVFAAQTIVKDRRKRERAAKFKLIVNGEVRG